MPIPATPENCYHLFLILQGVLYQALPQHLILLSGTLGWETFLQVSLLLLRCSTLSCYK